MERDFDIHNWQAKHLTKLVKESTSKVLNENVEDVAYEALDHIKAAYNVLTQYKEANQIASNESEFNDIEAMLEDVVERLEELAGDFI